MGRVNQRIRSVRCVGGISAIAALSIWGCDAVTEPEALRRPCEHVSEWGSVGCADMLIEVGEPSSDLTSRGTLWISVRWPDGGLVAAVPEPVYGASSVRLELPEPSLLKAGEPTQVWAVARIVGRGGDGSSTEILAADSVLQTITFTTVGDIPTVDTIRLAPR